jgi:hypothetical protein
VSLSLRKERRMIATIRHLYKIWRHWFQGQSTYKAWI